MAIRSTFPYGNGGPFSHAKHDMGRGHHSARIDAALGGWVAFEPPPDL